MNVPPIIGIDFADGRPSMIWVPTWDPVKGEWTYKQSKPAAAVASPPMSRRDLGPFEMPAKRNKPLPADHKGVVAVAQAVARML